METIAPAKIEAILNELKEDNIIQNALDPKFYIRKSFNCWGFTAYALGWDKYLTWYDQDDIEQLLDTRSIEISVPRKGDVVVYRDLSFRHYRDEDRGLYASNFWVDAEPVQPTGNYDLLHTAIIIGDKGLGNNTAKILQKPGTQRLEITTIQGAQEEYAGYCRGRRCEVSFRRPINIPLDQQLCLELEFENINGMAVAIEYN
jgi:hypothetical protein